MGLTKRLLRVGLVVVGLLLVVLLIVGGLWFWYTHRPRPDDLRQVLFQGVTYVREVRDEPRPIIIHAVTVDLDAPGVGFLVTPGDPTRELPLQARKTSQFLAEFDLQVAVNGDFFQPWHSDSPWDYYPHVGDPVAPLGFASSRGVVYSTGRPDWSTLYFSKFSGNGFSQNGRVSFDEPPDGVYDAISGNCILVRDGQVEGRVLARALGPFHNSPHPRTALALGPEGRRFMIVVVDGRQPNYSEGVTLLEFAEIVIEYKGYTALNLDGGGSTTLVVEGQSGEPVLLNSPIDNRIPGRERPVGNHLGLFARRGAAGAED